MSKDCPDNWIRSVKDGETGKVYSIEEFKKNFLINLKIGRIV